MLSVIFKPGKEAFVTSDGGGNNDVCCDTIRGFSPSNNNIFMSIARRVTVAFLGKETKDNRDIRVLPVLE